MSKVPIEQTGNVLSQADLNAEFPRFLRARSNQNADEIAVWNTAFGGQRPYRLKH
jgi:hypothetical protein